MKVLFIYSDLFPSCKDWPGHYYVGIGYLSSVLKEEGFETSLLHVKELFADKQDFLDRVVSAKPDLIAFSSTSLTFRYVQEMAMWLHDAGLGIPVVSGGIHSTLAPGEVIETPGIDIVCIGEGEQPLRELAVALNEGKDIRNIPSLWVKDGGQIHKNEVGGITRDLDSLPFPDRAIFDYQNLEHERNGKAVFMASRGCPYLCSYCSNLILQKTISKGKAGEYVRFRSVDNVIAEIKQVLKNYPSITTLLFDDDLFFLRKKWGAEFAEKYSAEIGIPFTCNMRPNHLNRETAALLKKAGCVEMKIGLESGNEWIRNSILKRNLSDEQMYAAFQYCHEAGIPIHSFNMVGLPMDTISTVLDTIKMNAKARADEMQVSIFCPMPKTELYDLCKEKNLTVDQDGYDYFIPMLNQGSISKERINSFCWNFRKFVAIYSVVYRLPSPFSTMMVKVLDGLFHTPFLDLLGHSFSLVSKMKQTVLAIVNRKQCQPCKEAGS